MIQPKHFYYTAIVLLSFLAGCGGETVESVNLKITTGNQVNNQINKINETINLPTPTPQKKPAGETNDNFEDAARTVKKDYRVKDAATLAKFRAARHENFDRIVFEFKTAEMPAYKIEYIDKPARGCGSGEVISLAGNARLDVSFNPARAHDDEGRAIVKNREQKLAYQILQEIKITCDFEAELTFALGVSAPNKYRVLELKNPTRLAIDISH